MQGVYNIPSNCWCLLSSNRSNYHYYKVCQMISQMNSNHSFILWLIIRQKEFSNVVIKIIAYYGRNLLNFQHNSNSICFLRSTRISLNFLAKNFSNSSKSVYSRGFPNQSIARLNRNRGKNVFSFFFGIESIAIYQCLCR